MSYSVQIQILNDAVIRGHNDNILSLIKQARHNECSPEVRLSVYHRGYLSRLRDAVYVDYPTLQYAMGKDAFAAAADAYVRTTASVFWDLNLYSIGFVDFIQDPPLRALATLESALTEIFWLPDSKPIDAGVLSALSMDELAEKQFALRAASKLLKLDYAVSCYMDEFLADKSPENIMQTTEHLLVVRHENVVRRLVLEETEYALLLLLSEGLPFGQALEQLSVPTEELMTRLPAYLSRWMGQGVLSF